MSNIADELGVFEKKRGFPFSKREIIFGGIILCLGFYIGNLLYGNNNLLTLLDLKKERTELEKAVKELNEKNAKLLKTYYELKVIEGGT